MVGQFKDDRLQDHYHNSLVNTINDSLLGLNVGGSGDFLISGSYGSYNQSNKIRTGTVNTIYRCGATTRTKEKGVKYIIKVL